MLGRIKNFESFSGKIDRSISYKDMLNQISENFAAAKVYMQKDYAKKKSMDYKDLTPEQKDDALNNASYKKVIDLIGNHHGYAGPFVKFHFEQGVPINGRSDNDLEINNLSALLKVLLGKKHIISRLPMKLEQYASLEKEGAISGFEKMTDDIRTIQRADGAKWLIDRLPIKLRDQYRKMGKEDQNSLINTAYSLDEFGKEITDRLLDKIKAMSSWNISDVIVYINEYLSGYSNLEMQKKMDEIKKLEPQAGILYSDDKYLAISVRTPEAQKKLCSVANWCINRGSFKSYNNGAVQINIFDYMRDLTDPLFLTGTTIRYSGHVSASHDINDTSIFKNRDYMENFKLLGYPEYVLKALSEKIPAEIMSQEIMDEVGIAYGSNMTEIVRKLVKIQKRSIAGEVSDKYWNKAIEIVSSLIKENGESYTKPLIKLFLDLGIMSYTALNIFNSLLGDVTGEEAKVIIDSTEKTLDAMEEYVASGYAADPSKAKSMDEVLSDREGFMTKVRAAVE